MIFLNLTYAFFPWLEGVKHLLIKSGRWEFRISLIVSSCVKCVDRWHGYWSKRQAQHIKIP